MKVTDLRRKLLAALAAGGLLAPGAIRAADLNVNLVTNGDFEAVDVNTIAMAYNSPLIVNWSGLQGFAYSHDGSSSSAGVVPDWADGDDPPGAGHWYFTSNGADNPEANAPGQFYQDINVSTGATGSAIAAGSAGFTMSAQMSSYLNDGDFGNIHAAFRNSSGTTIGTANLADSDPGPNNVWSLNTATGNIPVGTASVRLSVYGTAANGGPDGYIDNVDFRVSEMLAALRITVNRADGSLVLSNNTGSAVNLRSYSITSAFEALMPANWRSIADNYDAGNPGPNQVDAAHNWNELTDANAHGDLSEADLQAGTGASVANGRSINLGNAGTWIQTPTEDLVFQYISNGQIVNGIVSFVGNGNNPFLVGDLNLSGTITAADWGILRSNQFADLSGFSLAEAYRRGDLTADKLNNQDDFIAFKTAFEDANGAGSFAAMLAGVPEPSCALLVLGAGVFAVQVRRRTSHCK